MAKKKRKPAPRKLDPRLVRLSARYTLQRGRQYTLQALADDAGDRFAELAGELAGLKVGDFVEVVNYNRKVPAVVLGFTYDVDWDEPKITGWKVRYQQVKGDGTVHRGKGPGYVDGDFDPRFGRKWRKIDKSVVAVLATKQHVR